MKNGVWGPLEGQRGWWMAALLVAAIGVSSPNVEAFQVSSPHAVIPSSRKGTVALSSGVSSNYNRNTIDDSKVSTGLGAHERRRSPSPVTPSRMFLKAGQLHSQPFASLSSDFFDTPGVSTTSSKTTTSSLLADQMLDVLLPRRDRGILGFSIQDHGDKIVPSGNSPPSVSETSTSLHSSTDHSQERQLFQWSDADLQVWNVPEALDEEWLVPSSDNSMHHNPILNRSPNKNNVEKEDSSATAPAWFPWMPSITQIQALKVRELKRICADRGLKQMGNKAELQQRLWDWTRTQQHRQRRLMIGSNSLGNSVAGRKLRIESTTRDLLDKQDTTDDVSSPSSLEEWARTYNIEPLLQRREQIHKEKREGKPVKKKPGTKSRRRSYPINPSKEYLSKLFDAPSSQYSNFEVKEMYAAAKTADKNGDRVLCKQILHKLKEATPHDGRIHRRLARMEMEEGNVYQAREILQDGLRSNPDNAYLWHGLGLLEVKAGNDDASSKCFMKAIQLDPAFPNAYHACATREHTKGHIANAMKLLKAGLQYCPTNHRLHHALGDLYREAKLLDMAEKSFRRALEHSPEVSRSFAYTSLSHVAYELGDIQACRSWLRKAINLNNGRSAKGWLSMSRLEESEGNIDAARSVCIAALNMYEKGLLSRSRRPGSENTSKQEGMLLESARFQDPVQLKNHLLESVPKYRSGDHFLKVYRNWARLEENHGTTETVDDVYNRASLAFPWEWRVSLDWAKYHVDQWASCRVSWRFDRARLLFNEACNKASNKHADPYRLYAEFEMSQGMYEEARKILYHGALVISDSSDGGMGNQRGMAELYHTWAVCEWYLNNLSRAEVLFDHALRLTKAGEEGSSLRSSILYSIAQLEYEVGEYHLAQHCVCLCLKENALPGGNARVWELWAKVAEELGDEDLSEKCWEQASLVETAVDDFDATSLSVLRALSDPGSATMKEADMQKLMRKDPWHYRIVDVERKRSKLFGVTLPPEREELQD
ncbi:tetratricopeptide repeat [Seminavis robusta]|uniref:Tetratricopeptide repeat n=1 Tax=Seminavis robusta TaxID=568900 RepID=A0A9N8EIV3_9STRA|nr:tetratricopeptide repeat [Seminavis robusta]|eukprot:Sro1271_g258110.1 tetratricopeptide repeat (994) ;mRNA; r:20556-23758